MSRGCEAPSLLRMLRLRTLPERPRRPPALMPYVSHRSHHHPHLHLPPNHQQSNRRSLGGLAGLFRVKVHTPAFCSNLEVCTLGSESHHTYKGVNIGGKKNWKVSRGGSLVHFEDAVPPSPGDQKMVYH